MKYAYKNQQVSLSWKKDDGSGEYTEDVYLWVDGNPSLICVSGGEDGDYAILCYNTKRLRMGDSRKALKEAIFDDDIIPYLEKEIDSYL